mgnify:CR=1 FL=1
MRREAETLGEALRIRRKISREQIETISGVDTAKCRKCGKCTASCPVGEEMEKSVSLWKCLSCFACVQRCPRDVKPAKLIEAIRLTVIRERGQNYLSPDEIPQLLDPQLPQQLLVSAFRKYSK